MVSSQNEQQVKLFFDINNSEIRIYININVDLKNFYKDKVNEQLEIFKENNDKKEIDNMFKSPQYEQIFDPSINKEDLKRRIDEKGNRFRGNEYFENKKLEKLNQFDTEIENMKSRIINHFSHYYEESLNKSNENEFTNFFNSKKNEVQKYLTKEQINILYNNEFNKYKTKFIEHRIDKYFNEQYPKLYEVQNKTDLQNKLNNSGFNGNEYFNNKKNKKLNNYETDLLQYKGIISDFISNKYNQAFESSENEEQFKNFYDNNNSEILIYININNDLKAFYNNKVYLELEKFRKFIGDKKDITDINNFFTLEYRNIFDESKNEEDLERLLNERGSRFCGKEYFEIKKQEKLDQFDNEIDNMKSKIINHFSHYYEESLNQNNENEFTNFFNSKKDEVQKYLTKEKINTLYDSEFNKYKKKFNEYKIEKDIDTFFIENYPKIYNVKNKTDLENILNNNNFNGIEYFNKKKIEKLDKYESDLNPMKNAITDFIDNKYKRAFESSKNENEFKNYYLNNCEEIGKYFYNEDLKYFFDNKLDNKTASFINDFELKQKKQKEELEKKIREEKQAEFDNIEQNIKNEFFDGIEKEEFKDKKCVEKFKAYLELKIEEKDKAKNEDNNNQENNNNKEYEIIDLISKVIEIEKFEDKIRPKVVKCLEELLNDKTKKVNHLNILILGKTGVGKSTLINSILELENTEKALKTGYGNIVTLKIEFICSEKIDFLRCADSRGIEVGQYGIDSVQTDAEKFIDEQLKTNNPDLYIHCIWYCTIPLSDRFQNDEIKLLENLGKKYSMKDIPIIIVGTKAYVEESNINFKKSMENNTYSFNYPFIPVISIKKDRMGLEELKEISIAKAKEAVESACYQGVFKNLFAIIDKKFKNIEMVIAEKIQEKEKLIIDKIETEGKLETLENDLKDIFKYFLENYFNIKLFSSEEETVDKIYIYNNNSENIIKDLINDYINYCNKLIEQSYETILKEKIKKLSEIIIGEQIQFNIKNKNTITMKTKDYIQLEVKPKIENILKIKSNIYYYKNVCIIFFEILKDLIPFSFDIFSNDYKEKLEKDDLEIKTMVSQNIRIQFEELEEKIKKYNDEIREKKKKEEEDNGISASKRAFLEKRKKKK